MDEDDKNSNKIKAVVTALISRMSVLEQNYIAIANQQTSFTTLANRVVILEKQLYDCNYDISSINDSVEKVKTKVETKEIEKPAPKRKESKSSWVDEEPKKKKNKKRNNIRASSVASNVSESSDAINQGFENTNNGGNVETAPNYTLNHQCSQCQHQAPSKRALEDHIKKNHTEAETLYCAKCSYNSVVKQELIDHFRSVHKKQQKPEDQKKNSNKGPSEDSGDSTSQVQSQGYTTSINNHECSQCKHRANSKRELEDHIKKNHSDVETLYCAKCSYNSVVKQELIDHFRSIHRKQKD